MKDFIERCVAYLEGHMWHIACIYLVFLLYLSIFFEGALMETVLAILGGLCFIISLSFGMVKTPIGSYLLGFVLLEMVHLLFWGLTTSFIVEHSIYLAPCTFIH
jgi:hypothetical protein